MIIYRGNDLWVDALILHVFDKRELKTSMHVRFKATTIGDPTQFGFKIPAVPEIPFEHGFE